MSAAIDMPPEHASVITDAKAYADGRIYETYRWLRANAPVSRCAAPGFDPFWVLTRHADVQAVSRDNRLFPYGDRPSVLRNQATEKLMRALAGGAPTPLKTLIQMDAPEHMKHRLLTQAWFMPKQLKTIAERIAAIADDAVAGLAARGGTCDFVQDVALHYPLRVIMEILGVPEDGYPLMLKLTQELLGPQDPDTVSPDLAFDDPALHGRALADAMAKFDAYFAGITADRRANPRNDIASVIANAQVDGQPISDTHALAYYIIIATAGHDTTSSSTAAGMWALATQPALLERLRADPSVIPRFVEEAIRWATPVKTFMRSAAVDTRLGDQAIGAGDWLMLCYASANRDEAVFAHGDDFDIDRPATGHLAFGHGVHNCLGQHLARQEMVALFARLIPALRSVTLAGEPAMLQSYFVNGLKRLPIRFELDADAAALASTR